MTNHPFAAKGKCRMKIRKTVSAAISAVMLLTGCSVSELAGPPEMKILSSYSASCSITAQVVPPDKGEKTDFCFNADIKRLGSGFWEMDILSPETVAGMKITAAGDVVTSELGGLSFDSPITDISHNSPFIALFTALDRAAANENTLVSGDDGGWVLSDSDYTIVFDGSGCPVSMAISEPTVIIEFTSFESSSATLGTSTQA